MRCINSWIWGKSARALLFAATMLVGAPAIAECAQDDLTGVWWFTGVSGDVQAGVFSETVYCRLRFGVDGAIDGVNSECKVRNLAGENPVGVNGGRFTLNNACWLFGRINFCNQQFCDSLIIDEARMNRSKDTIALTAKFAAQPGSVTQLTGIKK